MVEDPAAEATAEDLAA
ncbi:hypothetical protein A2U01_0087351, partial [Trifolium medium]|nr:hypothetical protein [Trifolium medium]